MITWADFNFSRRDSTRLNVGSVRSAFSSSHHNDALPCSLLLNESCQFYVLNCVIGNAPVHQLSVLLQLELLMSCHPNWKTPQNKCAWVRLIAMRNPHEFHKQHCCLWRHPSQSQLSCCCSRLSRSRSGEVLCILRITTGGLRRSKPWQMVVLAVP